MLMEVRLGVWQGKTQVQGFPVYDTVVHPALVRDSQESWEQWRDWQRGPVTPKTGCCLLCFNISSLVEL